MLSDQNKPMVQILQTGHSEDHGVGPFNWSCLSLTLQAAHDVRPTGIGFVLAAAVLRFRT